MKKVTLVLQISINRKQEQNPIKTLFILAKKKKKKQCISSEGGYKEIIWTKLVQTTLESANQVEGLQQ